jgi:hypothetical protein
MNKPFYSDYVRHAMRFYSRNRKPSLFRTYADRLNWLACDRAIKPYSDRDKDILTSVYGGYDTLPDNVYEVATRYHINQNIIWDMMKKFEKEVAQMRDLI